MNTVTKNEALAAATMLHKLVDKTTNALAAAAREHGLSEATAWKAGGVMMENLLTLVNFMAEQEDK